jgi:hypothetical protein
MRGNVHFVIPTAKFTGPANPKAGTTLYLWGTGVAQRRFCTRCGILPWYTPRSNPDGVGITLACVNWAGGVKPVVTMKNIDGLHWEESVEESGIAAESK